MKQNEMIKQSIEFSNILVKYYKWLVFDNKEFILSKQILRSGTSIGANLHEAQYAISKPDFINKLHIALKEASETEYWLIILTQNGYLPDEYKNLKSKCVSLKKMLISSLKTIKIYL